MIYRILADLLVILHGLFILFVILGGLFVLKWRKLIWIHIPVALWGILVEYAGWICPLTPWENYYRQKAGMAIYQGDFVGHYILPLIYPEGLTHQTQLLLGSLVVLINGVVYFLYFLRKGKS